MVGTCWGPFFEIQQILSFGEYMVEHNLDRQKDFKVSKEKMTGVVAIVGAGTNGGREALSFGMFPQKVETRGQMRGSLVIQSNHSS